MGISKSYLKDKFLSKDGYKRNSPDVNRPYNVIPSNQITMEGVDFPVMGIDDIGNQQIMYPGNNYTFPGNYVTEFPVKNMGNKRFGQVGLEKRMPWEKPTTQDWNKLIKGEYKPEKDLGKEIERQSRSEGAKPIEEVRITAERPGAYTRAMNAIKPYVAPTGGFLDQVRGRMVESTGGKDWYKQPNSVLGAFAGTVTAPLAAPQQGMMYGLTGKVQTPSEALNIQNPVGAFVTDVALDPMTYLGVGASKLPQKVSQAVRPALRGASEYLTTQTPLKNIIKTPFKSEINWGKWNPDTPKYPELINEYNAIEESTKKAGTWMKNFDGSAFQGTPEQFIQQQSSYFKKAFPSPIRDEAGNVQFTYHGSPNTFDAFDENMVLTGRTRGHGIYTSPSREKAASYAKGKDGKLYEFYQNASKKQDKLANLEKESDERFAKFLKDNPKNSPDFDKKFKAFMDEEDKFYNALDLKEFKLQPGYDFYKANADEYVVPFTNYPKSAAGNVGFFDMTNPNIYKSVLPYAIPTSLGVGALQQYYNQKPKGTYQMGGTMSIPGVNGQVVSSGPQPLTSVKKTRGPITKTKKGDVKTMPTKAVKKILKNIK